MIIGVRKRKDGQVEILHKDEVLTVLTKEQAKSLADVLIAATK